MAIAGTYPEDGVRVSLELAAADDVAARYRGEAFTSSACFRISLTIDVATGKARADLEPGVARDGGEAAPLATADVAFITALGVQLHRQAKAPAEQGGGRWARRVQRWRGPK